MGVEPDRDGGHACLIAYYDLERAFRVSPMRMRRFGKLFVVGLALRAGCASAFLDPPYLTPTNPSAGETVFVNIYGGECDLVDMGIVWPPPVTQQASEITILFTGIHEGDPQFCFYGLGISTYPVGAFAPGAYTLDVERRYMSFSGPWVQETLGLIPFIVTGPPTPPQAAEAPALNAAGLAALLLALVAVASSALRRSI